MRAAELPAPIHERIFERARETPEAIAVSGASDVTYRELDRLARRVAARLRRDGGGPESLVGVCAGRSVEWVAAMLGALSAGCAFVPFDPTYPDARLAYMLQAVDVECILADDVGAARLADADVPVVQVAALLAGEQVDHAPVRVRPESLAYVIFTSGSGGRPKGVAVEHAAIANTTREAARAYRIVARDRVLQFASTSFDTAFEEVFPCLCEGGTLVLRDDAMMQSPAIFLEAVAARGVTVLDLPPAYWHELVNGALERFPDCRDLRLVILGGDRVSPADVSRWQETVGPRPALMTSYGPTETAVIVTAGSVVRAVAEDGSLREEIPIGDPIANVRLDVLDAAFRPVQPGRIGELCIGGVNVARGYHGQPAETAARFRPDPSGPSGSRVYVSGDLGRIVRGGQIEIVGRTDRQVKIRGFRVELPEIESALLRLPGIRQAAVAMREDRADDKRLAAYVVAEDGAPPVEPDAVSAALRSLLPAFMMPATVTVVERLALTPHGKVDYAALPAPFATGTSEQDEDAALTSVERQLIELWERVLGATSIAADDNFFELGGHSLAAMEFVAAAHEVGLEIPLVQVFVAPTVSALARILDQTVVA